MRLHGNPSPSCTKAPIPDPEIPRPMDLEEGVDANQESQLMNEANKTPIKIVRPSSIVVQQLEQTTSEPADAQELVGQSKITGVTSRHTSQSNEELEEPIDLVDYEAFESVLKAACQEDPFLQEEDEGKDKEEEVAMEDTINYDTIIQNLVNASTADDFPMHSQPWYKDPLLTFPHKIHSSLLTLNSNDAADIGGKRDASGLNFCSYLITFLAQILKSLFNSPVQAINHVIQVSWVLCNHLYRVGVEEGERRALVRAQAPSNSQEACVGEPVNPSFGQPQTIWTYHTKLSLKSTPLTNPCCPNKNCHHIFFEITGLENFGSLPPICPKCAQPLYNTINGKSNALAYPRVPVAFELARILAIPGVESILDNLADRIALDEICNSSYNQHIFREQYHGHGFDRQNTHPSNLSPSLLNGAVLNIWLNILLNWFNPLSSTMYEQSSLILVQLADLPQQI